MPHEPSQPPRGGDPRNRGRFSTTRHDEPDLALPTPGAPWALGADKIHALIREGRLTQVVPDTDLALRLIDDATENIEGAKYLAGRDLALPSFTSAYDAGRLCLTALLEHQGLRPRSEGSHRTVEEAAIAQLGPQHARQFGALRILRNALEYPAPGGARATIGEANQAIEFAERMTKTVPQMMDQMGVFR